MYVYEGNYLTVLQLFNEMGRQEMNFVLHIFKNRFRNVEIYIEYIYASYIFRCLTITSNELMHHELENFIVLYIRTVSVD